MADQGTQYYRDDAMKYVIGSHANDMMWWCHGLQEWTPNFFAATTYDNSEAVLLVTDFNKGCSIGEMKAFTEMRAYAARRYQEAANPISEGE